MSPVEGSVCPMARETSISLFSGLLLGLAYAYCCDAQEPVCGHEGKAEQA